MKAASAAEIKKTLKTLDTSELTELCLRLARFKKENKELLTYLLYEESDPDAYTAGIREEMDEAFAQVNTASVYFAKKSLRKILRTANKYIRYTGDKTIEAEVLLHYATNFNGLRLEWKKSTLLRNIYASVIKRIDAAVASMHEDLQHDYRRPLERLRL